VDAAAKTAVYARADTAAGAHSTEEACALSAHTVGADSAGVGLSLGRVVERMGKY
jgi:hypothetical protein